MEPEHEDFFENPLSTPARAALVITGVAAAFGLGLFFLSRPKTAAAQAAASSWSRVGDLTLRPGQRYRMSVIPSTTGGFDAASRQVQDLLDMQGANNIQKGKLWLDGETLPSDWPKEDLGPGRNRLEFVVPSGVGPIVFPPVAGVRIYVDSAYQAPPSLPLPATPPPPPPQVTPPSWHRIASTYTSNGYPMYAVPANTNFALILADTPANQNVMQAIGQDGRLTKYFQMYALAPGQGGNGQAPPNGWPMQDAGYPMLRAVFQSTDTPSSMTLNESAGESIWSWS